MSGDKFKIKLGNEVIGIAEDAAIKTVEIQTENFIEIINEYVDDKTLVLYKKIKNKYYFRNKILKLIDRATVEDLLEISQTVSKFLKEYQPGVDVDELLGIKNSSNESNEESDDTSSDDEDSEDLTLDDLNDYEEDENDSDKDNSDDDNDEDEKDDDSTNEEGSEIPDDFLI